MGFILHLLRLTGLLAFTVALSVGALYSLQGWTGANYVATLKLALLSVACWFSSAGFRRLGSSWLAAAFSITGVMCAVFSAITMAATNGAGPLDAPVLWSGLLGVVAGAGCLWTAERALDQARQSRSQGYAVACGTSPVAKSAYAQLKAEGFFGPTGSSGLEKSPPRCRRSSNGPKP